MGAMGFGLGMGALSLFSGLAGAEKARSGQLAQAAQARSQAGLIRAQAAADKESGEREAYELDKRKRELRREFKETMGGNRSRLGAGNVDMASGSALDVAEGNIARFAADMGDNAYAKALKLWETDTRERAAKYQAAAREADADYLSQTAGNIGASILTGLIGGAGGFASGYSMAGGSLKSLFGVKGARPGLSAISPGAASWSRVGGAAGRLAGGILGSGA